MYDQHIICKDVVEKHWIEFLTYLKQQQIEEAKNRAARKAAELKHYLDGDRSPYADKLLSECAEGNSYYMGVESFWRWYMDKKITV